MKLLSKCLLLLSLTICCYAGAFAVQQTDTTAVVVIKKEDPVPEGARLVGEIKVTDGGFKVKCSYEQTMEEAKEKARKKGANIVKITELKAPDVWSTCYRLRANVYQLDDVSALTASNKERANTLLQQLLPDTADYALLYVYRPRSSMGAVVQYNLHVQDSLVGRVKNGSSFIAKLTTKGNTTIWARTEGRDEVKLDIQPGKVYFLKCGINMGAFVGHPKLTIISPEIGIEEYNALNKKGKEEKVEKE